MAESACVQLDHPGAGFFDRGCIRVSVRIRFHDADAVLFPKLFNDLKDRACLPGAGASHEIYKKASVLFQAFPVFFGSFPVVREYLLPDFDDTV